MREVLPPAARKPSWRHREAVPLVTPYGGADPFLDRQFDAWLEGKPTYVTLHQLLNRLCRLGALMPGEYAVSGRA